MREILGNFNIEFYEYLLVDVYQICNKIKTGSEKNSIFLYIMIKRKTFRKHNKNKIYVNIPRKRFIM